MKIHLDKLEQIEQEIISQITAGIGSNVWRLLIYMIYLWKTQ